MERVRVVIRGAVQGVGFRPFVYRLASSLALKGWVANSPEGVLVEAEGERDVLGEFLVRLSGERPPRSFIQSLEPTFLDPVGFERFDIRASLGGEKPSALVLPDIATCDDCLRELFDPSDRRHRYPFINCTNCGPRFSIIRALPYDRPATTMSAFVMCEQCRAEYEDPLDRRFHAQPNACPDCGPRLSFWNRDGSVVAQRDDALRLAAEAIRAGLVVAIKGLGGFHLAVDARNAAAVRELRARKAREEKPFALMYPSLDAVSADCEVSPLERRLLLSAEAPIVLLRKRRRAARAVATEVAPCTPELGAMLPYTPLHHLLLAALGFPIVATSGNLSDEPICTDEYEALDRLGPLADRYLVHDRPIARHVDDSIARVVLGRELVLRRARGYAPLPVRLEEAPPPSAAVGAHLKNTIAKTVGSQVFVSQHVGDLETAEALKAFRQVVADFGRLYEARPSLMACDAHPDYLSSAYARDSGLPLVLVQHHEAHVLACMAENGLVAPVLGVSWDGTGFGFDASIWGGEFLLVTEQGCERRAALRTFGLPGKDRAVREPRRSALGLLVEAFGNDALSWTHLAPIRAFSAQERLVLAEMIGRGVNAPRTSSAGRLFDAVASIVGLQQLVRFEGQAAMALQFAAETSVEGEAYAIASGPCVDDGRRAGGDTWTQPTGDPHCVVHDAGPKMLRPALVLDWAEMLQAILDDMARGVPVGRISARFHNALADAIVQVASKVEVEQVALTGGCFQNALLLEQTVARLRAAGFRVYWHQRIPPNDGGISLGQIVAAARESRRRTQNGFGTDFGSLQNCNADS
jgi:hydrogenase maturation protein HypF